MDEGLSRAVREAFVPVSVSADVELLLSRTDTGYVVGLVNNNGVTKEPTRAPVTDPAGTRACVIRFKNAVPLRFTPRLGSCRWDNRAGGLRVQIGPGEVAVVEVELWEKRP